MKNVLFYGDSNTWGYQGDDPMHRLDADKRYTGVVAAQFPDVHFIEEGLCGRTICSTDPIDYGRNGMAMLPALLATHDPLDVIVIMLGTNDSKAMYGHSPFTISDAMDRTIKLMQSPLLWSNTMQKPQILLVAPPKMGENLADSVYYGMFDESSAALIRALPARFPPPRWSTLPSVPLNRTLFFPLQIRTAVIPLSCAGSQMRPHPYHGWCGQRHSLLPVFPRNPRKEFH